MIKIAKSHKKINPHSGVYFCIEAIENMGIKKLIDDVLGSRNKPRTDYTFSDAILGLIYAIFCGAERLKDVSGIKSKLDYPGLTIPSHHRISDIFRGELAVQNQSVVAASGIEYQFNSNPKLNRLLLKIALKLGLVQTQTPYILDYDNTVEPCRKWDAQWTYKKCKGYIPGVSWIGMVPVFIQNQSGNNPPSHQMFETLTENIELMDKEEIQIGIFRSDAAAYQRKVVEFMESRGIEFYIRANHCKAMWDKIKAIDNWEEVRIDCVEFGVAGFDYAPFGGDKQYRIMVSRLPNDKREPHKKTGEPFVYRCVLTNNRVRSNKEVLQFYNYRGAIEKNYDILNNDFMWKNLPFSFLHENTVFMIVTAIGAILYRYLITHFASRVDFVEKTNRMKTFRLNFISVAAEWICNTRNELVLLIHDQIREWEKIGIMA